MGRNKGIKNIPFSITVPAEIVVEIIKDARDEKLNYRGNVSRVTTDILFAHYKKRLKKKEK
jgi:hypothetical protein